MTPLATLSTYFIFPIAILGLLLWTRLSLLQKRIAVGLVIIASFQLVAILLSAFHYSNLEGYHIYILFELGVILYIFKDFLHRLFSFPIHFVLIGALICLEITLDLTISSISSFPSITRTTESVVVLLIALTYFFDTMRRQEVVHLTREPLFWVSSAYLIYFACNLLLFAFGTFIQNQSAEVFDVVWDIHAVLNILLYSILLIALLCKPMQTK